MWKCNLVSVYVNSHNIVSCYLLQQKVILVLSQVTLPQHYLLFWQSPLFLVAMLS